MGARISNGKVRYRQHHGDRGLREVGYNITDEQDSIEIYVLLTFLGLF